MDTLTIISSVALGAGAFAAILYPLWRQTRPEAIFRVDRAGQTVAEYEARYQAALAAVKDLMFDYEMGKVSAEDYQTLLQKTKLEAAQIRRQIDRLTDQAEVPTDPALDVEIETQVAQLRQHPSNGNEALRQQVDAEIERLKRLGSTGEARGPACPHCGKPFEPGDAFCTGCGQALPEFAADPDEAVCPDCGAAVEPDDAFCAACGAALKAEVEIRRN